MLLFFSLKEAEDALKFYKGHDGKNVIEMIAISEEFERLKSIANDRKPDEKVHINDFCEYF